MAQAAAGTITDPQRVKSFVKYFNNYVAAITIAVIPIPIANWNWLPIFQAQRHLLSIVTPIFCFLTIALLFFHRQFLARMMFRGYLEGGRKAAESVPNLNDTLRELSKGFGLLALSMAPLLLTVGALWSASEYYSTFVAATVGGASPAPIDPEKLPLAAVPHGGHMILFFVLAFVFAEAAFVWMALKEYLQDVLKITDEDLIVDSRNTKPVGPGPGWDNPAAAVARTDAAKV
jgi:hypothetical protein